MQDNESTITEKSTGERYAVPPPQWVVTDARGNAAIASGWTRLQAYRAGQRLLTDHLGRLAYPNLSVTPYEGGAS